jgi:hypothetical protein
MTTTPCINYAQSRWLPASLMRGVGYLIFKKKTHRIGDTESRRLPTSVIRWVADSWYPWVGESATPLITDKEKWRLRVSLSWGVDTPRIGESGSRYLIKISTIGNGWDLANCGWDLAECGWDISELWMRTSPVWMRSSPVVDVGLPSKFGSKKFRRNDSDRLVLFRRKKCSFRGITR